MRNLSIFLQCFQLFLTFIYRENFPWLFSAGIWCSCLPWLLATAICRGYLPWELILANCRGNFLCMWENPFYKWAKTFLFMKNFFIKAVNRTAVYWTNHFALVLFISRRSYRWCQTFGMEFVWKNFYSKEKDKKPISDTHDLIAIEKGVGLNNCVWE